ncbi:nicotinate-nucleotide adenylyltransferase [Nisaea acidiphila]|uniref:Probable nicotinate-nucleotide adenylyltransferase n=1 Tax=Nisaea acidiphila TaxID=1862145 RepID=A0A9J7ARZ4_9PROT|nr:nicotinate-nucleotide adenylyltransferase [Nisaea acidiphila]UUX48085.1 nicotinate-nucleotide adenylyltransferase [Nisaea acidiphila]
MIQNPKARRLLASVRGRTVAVMGGSFNPAHRGHLDIALLALQKLGADEVWWMVSPQNPLKTADDMAPFEERRASAVRLARGHPRIRVTEIEVLLGTRYTADTLSTLVSGAPFTRFIWVMGADNLVGFHRWAEWKQIFNSVVIAVFDRPTYSLRALSGPAARRFAKARIRQRAGESLGKRRAPAWVFFHTPLNPLSATSIRYGSDWPDRRR